MKIDKSWYIKPNTKDFPTDVSAGGVVIKKDKNKLLIALIRDKKYDDYLLPKGRVEKGESNELAAEREISEEAGLNNIKLIGQLGVKERLTFGKNEWRVMHYYLFVTDSMDIKQNLQEGENDYIVEWFNIDELPSFFWPEQKDLIEDNKIRIKKLIREF